MKSKSELSFQTQIHNFASYARPFGCGGGMERRRGLEGYRLIGTLLIAGGRRLSLAKQAAPIGLPGGPPFQRGQPVDEQRQRAGSAIQRHFF